MDHLKRFKERLDFHFSEALGYPLAKPYWIYMSLSHQCTYKCQMCAVVKILNGYELPTEVVKRTLDEISQQGHNCVIVFTGGEPFLRKDIFDLIHYATQRKITIEIVSNGSLIDDELASRIVSSGLHNIAISLDGSTPATHDSIRQKGAFQKAVGALRNLDAAKQKLKSGPQISIWTTIMKENMNELFDIIPLARSLGVECVVYHPVIVSQDDMQHTTSRAHFWIEKEDLNLLREQIDRIVEYRRDHGLVAFLHDPYLWIDYFQSTLRRENWKCNPFVFVNIGPDGEMRSCGASFGNINKMSFNDCLMTSDAFEAREVMKSCRKPCLQTCWAYPEGDALGNIVDSLLCEIADVPRKERKNLIRQALRLLQGYEQFLALYE